MTEANNRTPNGIASTQSGSPPNSQTDQLLKVRLDYVWDWWKFHAKQRTDMFNYFLIITGILANAYVNLLKDSHLNLTLGLGILGFITSIGFYLLDVRNRRQLARANEILQKIETNGLFSDLLINDKSAVLADIGGTKLYKHKLVFRGIEVLVAVGWLIMIIWSCVKDK